MLWRKYSEVGARVGDTVRGHNGYEWVVQDLDSFDLSIGSISAGLHNERISLQDCEVLIEGTYSYEAEIELDNRDLIDELAQLNGFIATAKQLEVNGDDYNHALLEQLVDQFVNEVHDAIQTFIYGVRCRYGEVLDELEDRGVFE